MNKSSLLLLAAALTLPLISCDDGGSSKSTGSDTKPGTGIPFQSIASCPVELPRTEAEVLLGISLPDSGHAMYGGRMCQWFSGFSWISWHWYTSGTLAGMMSDFEAGKVRTLGGDSGYCTRSRLGGFTQEYIVKRKTVSGMELVRVQPSESCVPDTTTSLQVWTDCKGYTLEASARRTGKTAAFQWNAGERAIAQICSNAR